MTGELVVGHVIRPQPRGSVGGADLHIVDLARAQAEAGGTVPFLIELGDTGFAAFARSMGVSAMAVPGAVRPGQVRRVAAALAEADVVHAHGYESDYVAAFVAGLPPRRRMVASSHGFVRYSPVMRAKTRLDEWSLRAALAVIACSRVEATRLRRFLGPRVHYVPNGVFGPERPGPWAPISVEGPRLGYVGRLSPEKRPDAAVRVLAGTIGGYPGATLGVWGVGPQRERLIALARELGVADRVRFHGLVRDVESIYDGLDILLCLSESEGTPRVVLEAMARRAPVVATAVGGVPELLGDGRGVLVAPGDVDAAVAAVDDLVAAPARARRITTAARAAWEEEFGAAAMARRVGDVYATLAPRRRSDRSAQPYWERVGTRLAGRAGSEPLAGDDTPYYRHKRALVAAKVASLVGSGQGPCLEVGCGPGRNLALAGARWMVGVDFAWPMLELAASSGAPVLCAAGEALPFRDRSFGQALAVTVLQHSPPPTARALVAEMARVADVVHVVEDVAVVHVRDRPSHVLRTVAAYEGMFAGQGFAMTAFEPMHEPVSEVAAVVARRVLNPAGRHEGDPVTAAHERWERTLLRTTRRMDAVAPRVVGIAAMTFERIGPTRP